MNSEGEKFVSSFYDYLSNKGVKRVFGGGIKSGDIVQLKKIALLPFKISFHDPFFDLKNNIA